MSEVIVKKVANAKKVTAWSYSRLSAYEQCPLKFKLTTLDGLKEPTSLAMERGKDIHKEGELYLGDISLPIPPSYKLLAVEMAALRALKVQSELEVTFTKDWQPTGWFDTDAWCRIKIDALAIDEGVVKIIDFKTGKNRGGYEDQLELYVLASLLMYPEHPHSDRRALVSGLRRDHWHLPQDLQSKGNRQA